MTRRGKIAAAIIFVAVLVVVAAAVGFLVLRDDGPDAATTDDAVAVLEDRQTDAHPEDASVGAPSAETTPVESQPVDGVWNVDTSIGTTEYPFDDRSYVGYRVQEELASIGGNTVVGRTPGVDGALTIAGTQITEVRLVADFEQLRSDSSDRDSSLRDQALETNTFPEASFVLTTPIELDSIPADGETITTDATGDLTLHGVTNTVTIPLEATLVGDTIAVVGRAPVAFADYDIDAPTAALVVSIDDVGELELQLFFARAGITSAG
jgi:polyisoprenoid-binding protein YceI